MLEQLPLFPERASTMAGQVDALFFFLVAVSGFFALVTAALVLYFSFRYRRRSNEERPEAIEGAFKLEVLWTVIPFGLTMIMFVWGAIVLVLFLSTLVGPMAGGLRRMSLQDSNASMQRSFIWEAAGSRSPLRSRYWALPVMTLAPSLPTPVRLATPVRVRFSSVSASA